MKLTEMQQALPPLIARKEVEKFLGGVVKSKTLANADAEGSGPEIRFKIGRTIAYQTESLLRWLEQRSKL